MRQIMHLVIYRHGQEVLVLHITHLTPPPPQEVYQDPKKLICVFDALPNARQLLTTSVPITCGPSIKNKKEMKTSYQPFKRQKLLDERVLAITVVMDNMDMVLPNEVK
jgi:hypothetical protein